VVSGRKDTSRSIMDYEIGQFDRDDRFLWHATYHPSEHLAFHPDGHNL